MSLEDFDNIAVPSSPGPSTCGYCSPPGQYCIPPGQPSAEATSHHVATLKAIKLSSSAYQGMIDRGWRRCGTYCYKPNLKISCCPQYTIKLDAMAFKLSRSQRKLLNRWNRFVLHGSDSNTTDIGHLRTSSAKTPSSKTSKPAPFMSLSASIHESEFEFQTDITPCHKFEMILEPASYSPQKFALYQKYQSEIHKDKSNDPDGFKKFLVDSPLKVERIPYPAPPPNHLPLNYGTYHQLYMLDGQLFAMGVLDILPNCVSSVYFMYDMAFDRYSLGKLSALREATLAREMKEAGAPGMGNLYMGFYIHSCRKMRYKGEYSPSYLADPENYEWFPLDTCIPTLETYRYACFSQPDLSSNESNFKNVSEPASSDSFDNVQILASDEIIAKSIKETNYLSYGQVREELGTCIRGLGPELANKFVFAI